MPPLGNTSSHGGDSSEHQRATYATVGDAQEAHHDLREFLKVVRPDWSHFNKRGTCNIDKVMAKLKFIGVVDLWDLLDRVETGSLNEELFAAGKPCFSEKTLDLIRHERNLLNALDHLTAPSYRQVGLFAPVPQLLTSTNRWSRSRDKSKGRCKTPLRRQRPFSHTRQPLRPVSAGNSHATFDTYDEEFGDARSSRPPTPCTREGMEFINNHRPMRYTRVGRALCWAPTSGSDSVMDASGTGNTIANKERSLSAHTSSSASRLQSNVEHEDEKSSISSPQSQWARSRHSSDMQFSEMQRRSSVAFYPSWQKTLELNVEPAENLENQISKLQRIGTSMSTNPRCARWNNLTNETLLSQGELMLSEQKEMDTKREMLSSMCREGPESSTRRIVASNIKKRLKEEKSRDGKVLLDVHYACTGIRKNLAAMANARRDLNAVVCQSQKLLGEDDEQTKLREKYGCLQEVLHIHHDYGSDHESSRELPNPSSP